MLLKGKGQKSLLSIAADILSGSKTGGLRSKLTVLSQWVEKTLCDTLHSFKEGYARRKSSDVTGTVTVLGSKLQRRAKADKQVSSGLGGKLGNTEEDTTG